MQVEEYALSEANRVFQRGWLVRMKRCFWVTWRRMRTGCQRHDVQVSWTLHDGEGIRLK